MKKFKIFSDDVTLKEKVQILVSICALTVAVSGTFLSYNLSNMSRTEKKNEFISTMNIVKRTIMTTYSSAVVYQDLSLVKLNECRKKTNSFVPMTFTDIEMLGNMIVGKDNVMKKTDEVYDLFVVLKALELEIKEYNKQFNNFYNYKESELPAFEANVLLPNLKLIENDCVNVLKILKKIEKSQRFKLIDDDILFRVNDNQIAYLKDGSKYSVASFPGIINYSE